ncbi:MAG: glycosyltransferase [Flammeovirgaceae bacterium]
MSALLFYLFVITIAVQLIYIWVLFGRAAFQKDELATDRRLPVSVIVAARNEFENLQTLIPALLEQDYPNYEIIIVDDKSDDTTYDFLLEIQAKYDRIKLVRINHTPEHLNSKKYALTLGIKAAKHEVVLLTDADCVPLSKQWIAEMTKHYQKGKDIVIGLSPYQKRKGLLNKIIRYETFYVAIQYLSMALWGKPYMGVGRNLSYKKNLFFANKGFHSHRNTTGGDDDLFISEVATGKNTAIAFVQEAQTESIPKIRWKDWYKQKVRHLSVSKQYKLSDKIILGLMNLSHANSYIFLGLGYLAGVNHWVLLGGYGIRIISLLTLFYLFNKKFRQDIEIYLVPLFDILYIFYYIFVSTKAYSTKKVAWK